jgi:hypothetical protein
MPRVAIRRPRCVGPAVGTSGGGGLAVASAADAVLSVVAAAITAIEIFVVVLGPVATGATIGRARWCGRWCLGRRDATLV